MKRVEFGIYKLPLVRLLIILLVDIESSQADQKGKSQEGTLEQCITKSE